MRICIPFVRVAKPFLSLVSVLFSGKEVAMEKTPASFPPSTLARITRISSVPRMAKVVRNTVPSESVAQKL